MDYLKETITIDVKLTPEAVAALFVSMDSVEQAMFFNKVAEDAKDFNFPFQMCCVGDQSILTHDARYVMRIIGEHSQKTT